MGSEQDRVFFYNYSIIIGILAVMILVLLLLARHLGIDEDAIAVKQSTKVAANTAPVGVVNIAGETEVKMIVATAEPASDEPVDMGERVYQGLCITCHNGLPGIPRTGDVLAWAPRIAQGNALLYERAIKGYISEGGTMAMPAKGGNMALSDEEVKAAVDYMVANSQ